MEKNGKEGRVGEGGKRREGRGGKAEERKREGERVTSWLLGDGRHC